mmetsp:Transcript_2327/g.7651  ORF Transcript_2327/g.7651 Transcript_2327/m.7651 type:complete len:235 (+) Transcript_2327:317-1021(+)
MKTRPETAGRRFSARRWPSTTSRRATRRPSSSFALSLGRLSPAVGSRSSSAKKRDGLSTTTGHTAWPRQRRSAASFVRPYLLRGGPVGSRSSAQKHSPRAIVSLAASVTISEVVEVYTNAWQPALAAASSNSCVPCTLIRTKSLSEKVSSSGWCSDAVWKMALQPCTARSTTAASATEPCTSVVPAASTSSPRTLTPTPRRTVTNAAPSRPLLPVTRIGDGKAAGPEPACTASA